jgi:hypothetical protein
MDIESIIELWKSAIPTKWFDDKEGAREFAVAGWFGTDGNSIYAPGAKTQSGCAPCAAKYSDQLSSLWPVASEGT